MRAPRNPTLLDIARKARVAPMTVSRVVNRSGYVSRAVRERVERAVQQLDYRPNALARSLKRQRTHVVGLLLPDIANPFSAELSQGIQQVLLERGYSCFLATSERSIEREEAALRAFFDHRVDGIIVATRETPLGNEALARLAERRLPIVAVGRDIQHPAIDRVYADEERGARDAVEHLLAQGHRRIGFLGVNLAQSSGLRRFRGYRQALEAQGLEVEEELVAGPEGGPGPGYSTQADGYAGMKSLLGLRPAPTAVFARNDFTALGAICAARDLGLRIPEDIAVVGFDNVPLAAYTIPPLTTVDQPTTEQGRQAAALLLERCSTPNRPRQEVPFPCRLIVRQSTQRVSQAP
jgi:DNA-binding LacI/PurR family transcriptional regulator